MGAAGTYLLISLFRSTPALGHLRHSQPVLYGALGGLCILPAALLIRISLTLKEVPGAAARGSRRNTWLRVAFLAAVLAVLGLTTADWTALAVGVGVGLIVWGAFYLRAGKAPRQQPENGDERQGEGRA